MSIKEFLNTKDFDLFLIVLWILIFLMGLWGYKH